jgi:hypothetical protein
MKLFALATCLVFVAACGSSPTAPTVTTTPVPVLAPPASAPAPPPPPATLANIHGTWTGRFDLTIDGSRSAIPVRVDIQQQDATVSGQWSYSGPTNPVWDHWKGSISGTVSLDGSTTRMLGTLQVQGEVSTGTGACFANAAISGTASSSSIAWSAPTMSSPNCRGDLRDFTFTLNK